MSLFGNRSVTLCKGGNNVPPADSGGRGVAAFGVSHAHKTELWRAFIAARADRWLRASVVGPGARYLEGAYASARRFGIFVRWQIPGHGQLRPDRESLGHDD